MPISALAGACAGALGQGELARQAFSNALQIAERLARAEPDRADYCVDIVKSLAQAGTGDTPEGPAHLLRAWALLARLKESGRLSAVDEELLPALQQILEERGLPRS